MGLPALNPKNVFLLLQLPRCQSLEGCPKKGENRPFSVRLRLEARKRALTPGHTGPRWTGQSLPPSAGTPPLVSPLAQPLPLPSAPTAAATPSEAWTQSTWLVRALNPANSFQHPLLERVSCPLYSQ